MNSALRAVPSSVVDTEELHCLLPDVVRMSCMQILWLPRRCSEGDVNLASLLPHY